MIYERDGQRSFYDLNKISKETWDRMNKNAESAMKKRDKAKHLTMQEPRKEIGHWDVNNPNDQKTTNF